MTCRSDAAKYINDIEYDFENRLKEAAEKILSKGSKIIALSGPTCSGKTTTASHLTKKLESLGHRAVVLSIDDFYKDKLREMENPQGVIDFDTVNTIDLEYLAECVSKLLSGCEVMMPKFDFATGLRTGYSRYIPHEEDVYILEGIQAVYPEVTSLLGRDYASVFINVQDDVVVNGEDFKNHEVRLLRRIVRDSKFRNASPEFTLHCWGAVRSNEETNIFPNIKDPDVYIDSFLPYELFVISGYAAKLLQSVTSASEYHEYALELLSKIQRLDGRCFFAEDVPAGSMFREFIGSE